MSYDFACFSLPPGADPETAYGEAMEDDSAGPLIPEVEASKQRLADLLRAQNSRLEQFHMDYDAVAARRGLSVDEVRRQYRHIELTDEETGAQFTINDWGVSITLPYWHKTGKADSVFAELWACLSVIEATTGYVTYDPQLERVLSLRRDQAEVIRRYVGVSDHLEELVSGQTVAEVPNRLPEAKKRPWWKFW